MNGTECVHGYSEIEASRLCSQAHTLEEILHHHTVFPPSSRVLEAGCGVGAQTAILATKNPSCHFVSVDISRGSVEKARERMERIGISNVQFQRADIFDLPFEEGSFD